MNILGFLDRPTEGKLLLDGEEINKLDDETFLPRLETRK